MDEHDPLTAERLFERYFWPLYPDDTRRDLGRARTVDANPAGNVHILRSLDEIAETFVGMAPAAFGTGDLGLDQSDASVHRLSVQLDREKRDRWTRERGPDGAPLLVHVVVHGAIYVGSCALHHSGASWQVRRPLWESLVRLASPLGEADLPVFHWWLKSLSDSEIDRHTLGDRYRAHVEQPTMRPDSLAPILAEPRPIPRLAKVRYDTLHKHLRAHLPEMRDLGPDFPSAERLAELRFRHLDFTWLGGARMLLVHGPAEQGVHLFWLDGSGFAKAAYYPVDPGTNYEVRLDGDVLVVSAIALGKRAEHATLWWGP
jgi:hypothetical protein